MLAYFEEEVDPVLERAELEIRVLEKMLKEANDSLFIVGLGFGSFGVLVGILVTSLL